jgi:hypothetical protein
MVDRYLKYKQVGRIQLFGDDDLLKSVTSSVYRTPDSSFTNGKIMRFSLNGALNHIKLSKCARICMEASFMPTVTNMNNTIIRLVTSTEDAVYDTKKRINGNPILCTFRDPNTQIYNCSEFFYNLNIPPNFLEKGYIELEIESNSLSANIDFLTGTPLNKFFITLIIVDKDNEITTDINLGAPVDMKNYNINMPIKPY